MSVSYVQRLGTPVLKQFWQDVLQLNDLLRREECPCALAVTTYVCLLSNRNFSSQFVLLRTVRLTSVAMGPVHLSEGVSPNDAIGTR